MFGRKHAFTLLPTDEHEPSNEETKQVQIRGSGKRAYIFASVALLSSFLLVSTWLLVSKPQPISPEWSSCGNTLETAHSRNCSFDLISFAWQTPECYDADLVSEFASWTNWTFFADDKFTEPVSQGVALHGNRTLFVRWDYHMVHCTFMWRQMHRAYERGWIDGHLGNYNHTLHCQKMMLMDGAESAKLITMARVIYPECHRVGHPR